MTRTKVPLEALLRRMSRVAEQVFDKQGAVDLMWLAETASGEQIRFVTPVYGSTPLERSDHKDAIAAEVRATFTKRNGVRYASAVEAWIGPAGPAGLSRSSTRWNMRASGTQWPTIPSGAKSSGSLPKTTSK